MRTMRRLRTLSPLLPVLAAAVLLPVLELAQGSDLGERVLALKQSLETDQAALRKYEWIETTIVSYKSEEKSNAQKRCYYGADGVLQKVPVATSQADMPGGVRGRMAKRKKEDVTEYMQKAVELIHQYVHPQPGHAPESLPGRPDRRPDSRARAPRPPRLPRLLDPGRPAGCRGEPHEQQDSWPPGGNLHRQTGRLRELEGSVRDAGRRHGLPGAGHPRRDEAERPRGHTEHWIPAGTAVSVCCAQFTTDEPHDRRGVTP